MAKSFIFELFWKELLGFSYFYWPVEQGRLKLYQIHKKSHSKVLTWNRKRDSWVFLNLKFPPHTLHLIKGDLRRLCKEFKPKSFLYVKAKEEWKTSQLGWVLQSGWKRWIKARLMCCLSSPPLRHKYPKRLEIAEEACHKRVNTTQIAACQFGAQPCASVPPRNGPETASMFQEARQYMRHASAVYGVALCTALPRGFEEAFFSNTVVDGPDLANLSWTEWLRVLSPITVAFFLLSLSIDFWQALLKSFGNSLQWFFLELRWTGAQHIAECNVIYAYVYEHVRVHEWRI